MSLLAGVRFFFLLQTVLLRVIINVESQSCNLMFLFSRGSLLYERIRASLKKKIFFSCRSADNSFGACFCFAWRVQTFCSKGDRGPCGGSEGQGRGDREDTS